MTTALVLRLDKQRAEILKQAARQRRKTRNAVVRQALDNLLGEPAPRAQKGNGATARRKSPANRETKGVGWAEHFEWLKKHGRKIDWKDVEEFENLENNRGFR